eukprot:sb/3462220/
MRGCWTDLSKVDRIQHSPSLAVRTRSVGLRPKPSPSLTSLYDLEKDVLSRDEGVVERRVFNNPGKYKVMVKKSHAVNKAKKNISASYNNLIGSPDSYVSLSPSSSRDSVASLSELNERLVNKSKIASKARDSVQLLTIGHVQKFVATPPTISVTNEDNEDLTPIMSPGAPQGLLLRHRDSLGTALKRRGEHRQTSEEEEDEEETPVGENTISNSGVLPLHPGTPPQVAKTHKVPDVTPEMLSKHSLHYYLMNNFFVSDSSSFEEGSTPTTPRTRRKHKKVRFDTSPNVIYTQPRGGDYAFIEAGALFQTRWETLDRHPHTLLGGQEKWNYYDVERKRFVFEVIKWVRVADKDNPDLPDEPVYLKPDCFESVLFYYQDYDNNTLRCPKGIKSDVFLDTLKFFKIPQDEITVGPYEKQDTETYDHLVPHRWDTLQARIWLVLYHKCSTPTKIFTVVDVIFIIASVVSCIAATFPDFRPPSLSHEDEHFFERFGATWVFVKIDGICMIWFFIIFILQFYAAPRKSDFLLSFQTTIDLILIASYVMMLAVAYSPMHEIYQLRQFLRLTFSLRILRLSRHSMLLNSLGVALKEAARELISVILFLFVIVFMFACIEYFVEVKEPTVCHDCTNSHGNIDIDDDHRRRRDEEEEYGHDGELHHSILEYVWWSLITITTIGYGEPTINTVAGKIFGGMCAIAGVPLFAIPIPILSKHLERVYQREVRKDEFLKEQMQIIARAIANGFQEGDEEDSEDEESEMWKRIVALTRIIIALCFIMLCFPANEYSKRSHSLISDERRPN